MNWEKPTLTDVNMNAEIGAYQEDFHDGNAPVVDALRTCETASRDSRATGQE